METSKIAEAVEQYVNSEDWDQARRIAESNPELLSDEVQTLLADSVSGYREAGREEIADYLEQHRTVLARSREVGTEKAFQEANARAVEAMERRVSQIESLMPASPDPLQSVVWQLLMADSAEQVDRIVSENPGLVRSEDALRYIDSLIQQAKDNGYDEALRFLREYHELLQTIYEMPPLMRSLQELIAVPTWTESRDVIKNNPELLSDEAIQTMDRLISEAENQGDEATARILSSYRQVLQRSREVGPDQAISELVQPQ